MGFSSAIFDKGSEEVEKGVDWLLRLELAVRLAVVFVSDIVDTGEGDDNRELGVEDIEAPE